jgi:hypothetical protein
LWDKSNRLPDCVSYTGLSSAGGGQVRYASAGPPESGKLKKARNFSGGPQRIGKAGLGHCRDLSSDISEWKAGNDGTSPRVEPLVDTKDEIC